MADALPTIKGFLPSTLIDWEGQIASEVFLPGCNFRCPYCHARALVLEPDALPTVDPDTVRKHLEANRGWIDGVVISGGEPTLHAGLPALCHWFRSMGLAAKLDTNGSRPDVLEQLLRDQLVDCVSMDVKAPFDERYAAAVRVECDPAAMQRSARLLIDSGVAHEFRTTVCPAVSGRQDILDIAQSLGGAQRYVLQPFRPVDCLDPAMETVAPLLLATLRDWAAQASQFVPRCQVRGESG